MESFGGQKLPKTYWTDAEHYVVNFTATDDEIRCVQCVIENQLYRRSIHANLDLDFLMPRGRMLAVNPCLGNDVQNCPSLWSGMNLAR